MQRESGSKKLELGSKLPSFELRNIDGRKLGTSYLQGAKAQLVAFMCNHCPYVKGSEESLVAIVNQYEKLGLKAVAINSNDAIQYPEDNFENMKAKANAMALPYPYLYDETQEVAKLFDAECTPEFYLFDSTGTLVYHGTINDSPRDKTKVTKDFLGQAVKEVLEGKNPSQPFVHPLGCSIKWRR